jgi:hypothetical protein
MNAMIRRFWLPLLALCILTIPGCTFTKKQSVPKTRPARK